VKFSALLAVDVWFVLREISFVFNQRMFYKIV